MPGSHLFRCAPLGLALLLLDAPAHAEPARELIVHLARRPLAVAPATREAGLAVRLGALDLTLLRRLDEGLPPALDGRDASPHPFALDPSRVLLVAAPDSASARIARMALLADPEVLYVEPNVVREPCVLPPGFPSDPLFQDGRQWGLRNLGPAGPLGGVAGADIHAREAWARSVGARDLRLAVADTGVDPDQPELQAPLAGGGWRMELGINVTSDPSPSYADSFGHGTPVAGVMAARTHEGAHFDSLGMAGVCGGDGHANPGCRVVPIKISRGRTGVATSFDIARAMLYATRAGARAMNLSFAGGGPSRLERLAMLHAITHGCVVVAAAGNRANAQPQYPAAYAADGLGIQVGASNRWDRRAPWSSHGPGLDLVAPGEEIWSCWMTYVPPGGAVYPGYASVSGTSFAAPFVTGTIGLLAAARPELMDTDFQHLLRESADDVGAPGPDAETGWGRLNAAAALAAVDPALGIWHDEVAGTEFTPAGVDTLVLREPGPAALERLAGPLLVERVEVRATVTLPDSFRGPVRVWPRVGGTFTGRGSFRMPYWTPWAEVIAQDGRSFTLRGYVFRVADSLCDGGSTRADAVRRDGPRDGTAGRPGGATAGTPGSARAPASDRGTRAALCPGEPWLPLPPDQARFGFSVLGPVERAPVAGVPGYPGGGPRLTAHPNPFRHTTHVNGPPGAGIMITDVAGRVMRRGALDGRMGGLDWDGRDAMGRRVRPGLYFVRCDRPAGVLSTKVVRID